MTVQLWYLFPSTSHKMKPLFTQEHTLGWLSILVLVLTGCSKGWKVLHVTQQCLSASLEGWSKGWGGEKVRLIYRKLHGEDGTQHIGALIVTYLNNIKDNCRKSILLRERLDIIWGPEWVFQWQNEPKKWVPCLCQMLFQSRSPLAREIKIHGPLPASLLFSGASF